MVHEGPSARPQTASEAAGGAARVVHVWGMFVAWGVLGTTGVAVGSLLGEGIRIYH